MKATNLIATLFSTVAVSGVGAAIYFRFYWGANGDVENTVYSRHFSKWREKQNASYFGKTPQYRTQLNSLDKTTKSNIPFFQNQKDVKTYDKLFLAGKTDFVFSNPLPPEGDDKDDITWSCEAEQTVEENPWSSTYSDAAFNSLISTSDTPKFKALSTQPPQTKTLSKTKDEKINATCRFFIPKIKNGGTAAGKDAQKCKIYSEDLTFFSFKHISSQSVLPPKILISVDKKEDENSFTSSFYRSSLVKYIKKISLKKNGKDYLSIDLKDLEARKKCTILTKQDISYFLVQAVAVEESLKTAESEKLFKKENGINKKNYVCKSDYQISLDYFDSATKKTVSGTIKREKNEECEIFQLKNNDKNVTNLSQYVSDLVSSRWEKEQIDSGKFYILKIDPSDLASYFGEKGKSASYVDKDNKQENSSFDNSHIRIYDTKGEGHGEKLHARFKLVSKINAYQNKEKPKVFHANHDYKRKLFIAKVKSNQITSSTNLNDLKCSYLFSYKQKIEDCKIYKFDEEIKNIDNLSFKKGATEVTDLSKDNIKNDSYYIVDFYSDKWISKYKDKSFFSSSDDVDFEKLDIVLESSSTKQKVDLTLETQFFGDYTKPTSKDNPFFFFKEEKKLQ